MIDEAQHIRTRNHANEEVRGEVRDLDRFEDLTGERAANQKEAER